MSPAEQERFVTPSSSRVSRPRRPLDADFVVPRLPPPSPVLPQILLGPNPSSWRYVPSRFTARNKTTLTLILLLHLRPVQPLSPETLREPLNRPFSRLFNPPFLLNTSLTHLFACSTCLSCTACTFLCSSPPPRCIPFSPPLSPRRVSSPRLYTFLYSLSLSARSRYLIQ